MTESVFPLVYPKDKNHREALFDKREEYQQRLEEKGSEVDALMHLLYIPEEYRRYCNEETARLLFAISVLDALAKSGTLYRSDILNLPFWQMEEVANNVFSYDFSERYDQVLLNINIYTEDIGILRASARQQH